MVKAFELGSLINPDEEPRQSEIQQRGAEEPERNRSRDRIRKKSARKPPAVQEAAKPVGAPKRLSLSLDAETYRRLRLLALETDRTHQAILEEAARTYLRKYVPE